MRRRAAAVGVKGRLNDLGRGRVMAAGAEAWLAGGDGERDGDLDSASSSSSDRSSSGSRAGGRPRGGLTSLRCSGAEVGRRCGESERARLESCSSLSSAKKW